ncbi:MAG: sugar kinase [Clostridiales bacterium]|nr:sugar kinase [Clostridiales bacterium]MBE5811797.1 sugar kinase [Clostridiales bacterium]
MKFVGFGDMLISFEPVGYQRLIQANTMQVNYTGAEANVCVNLAQLGVKSYYVGKVPDNDIGRCALANMCKYRVNVDHVAVGGDRLGVIYTEKGAAQRPSKVIYDRKNSAFTTSTLADYNWDEIMAGAKFFHFTGITAALSDEMPAILQAACDAAHRAGALVSCDLNYRKNLWSVEKARQVMQKLASSVDLMLANEEDADKVLDIRAADSDITAGKLSREGYAHVAEEIHQKYGCRWVGISLRESISASDNRWSGMFYDNGTAYFSRTYDIHIVNRVGGGDSFSSGLIYACMNGFDPQKTVDFAVAASCLKHSIEQDFNLVTLEEITRLMEGDGSGRVQR